MCFNLLEEDNEWANINYQNKKSDELEWMKWKRKINNNKMLQLVANTKRKLFVIDLTVKNLNMINQLIDNISPYHWLTNYQFQSQWICEVPSNIRNESEIELKPTERNWIESCNKNEVNTKHGCYQTYMPPNLYKNCFIFVLTF